MASDATTRVRKDGIVAACPAGRAAKLRPQPWPRPATSGSAADCRSTDVPKYFQPDDEGKKGHLSGTVGDEPAVLMMAQLNDKRWIATKSGEFA